MFHPLCTSKCAFSSRHVVGRGGGFDGAGWWLVTVPTDLQYLAGRDEARTGSGWRGGGGGSDTHAVDLDSDDSIQNGRRGRCSSSILGCGGGLVQLAGCSPSCLIYINPAGQFSDEADK